MHVDSSQLAAKYVSDINTSCSSSPTHNAYQPPYTHIFVYTYENTQKCILKCTHTVTHLPWSVCLGDLCPVWATDTRSTACTPPVPAAACHSAGSSRRVCWVQRVCSGESEWASPTALHTCTSSQSISQSQSESVMHAQSVMLSDIYVDVESHSLSHSIAHSFIQYPLRYSFTHCIWYKLWKESSFY